jgi:hypothetical protein
MEGQSHSLFTYVRVVIWQNPLIELKRLHEQRKGILVPPQKIVRLCEVAHSHS